MFSGEEPSWIVKAGLGAWAAVLSWLWRDHHERLKGLEHEMSGKADSDDLAAKIERHASESRSAMSVLRSEVSSDVRRLEARIDAGFASINDHLLQLAKRGD